MNIKEQRKVRRTSRVQDSTNKLDAVVTTINDFVTEAAAQADKSPSEALKLLDHASYRLNLFKQLLKDEPKVKDSLIDYNIVASAGAWKRAVDTCRDNNLRVKDVYFYAKQYMLDEVKDELIERTVNGKTIKVKELQNSEEAKKFLDENPGFSAVDEEDGKIYAALNTD